MGEKAALEDVKKSQVSSVNLLRKENKYLALARLIVGLDFKPESG